VTRALAILAALVVLALAPASASAAGFPAGFDTLEAWFTAQNQVGDSPQGTAVADFDQDSKPDVVAVTLNSAPGDQTFDIIVLKGDGFGNFNNPVSNPGVATDGMRRVTVGHFNNDSDPDLAVSNSFTAQVFIFLGATQPNQHSFTAGPVLTATGGINSNPLGIFGLVARDFDGDGDSDIALGGFGGGQNNPGRMDIFTNTSPAAAATPTFSAPQALALPAGTSGPFHVAAGHFNGDNDWDLAVAHSSAHISIWAGSNGNQFANGGTIPTAAGGNQWVEVADFDDDGEQDLVLTNATSGANGDYLRIWKGGAGFAFSPAFNAIPIDTPGRGAIGDFNGDGDEDVAVPQTISAQSINQIHLFLGDAGATLVPNRRPTLPSGNGIEGLSADDFDVDGFEDITGTAINDDQVILHDSLPPEPIITGTIPPPPANSNNPRVQGLVYDDAVTTVDVWTNGTCTGAPALENVSKEDFEDGKLNVGMVPDNQTTQLSAWANRGFKHSNCSAPFAYVEDSDVDNDGQTDDTVDTDDDNDGDPDLQDNCQLVPNPGQENNDGDPQGDACDPDDDNDGVKDTDEAGQGTDPKDPDSDGDGANDKDDNCATPNPGQEDTDGDGAGDACDSDDDEDGVPDSSDICPAAAGATGDTDGDGQGDACDQDDDADGLFDGGEAAFKTDPKKPDTDGDGIGDLAELNQGTDPTRADTDGDGANDNADNCVIVPNAGQPNADGDAMGDACDPDDDADGRLDSIDNCPSVPNPDQLDVDANGIGKVCDPNELAPGKCANAKAGTAAAETIEGSAAGDRLTGVAGNDILRAFAGLDCLNGGSGNDSLFGGDGADELKGGKGNDKLYGEAGNDTLAGESGNDALSGGAGNDKISGSAGNDKLNGAAGNDSLNGGAGTNTYSAGAGNDRIVSRNRRRETINCGTGKDLASIDRIDRVISCETVRRG
jgi:hypothetical protein